MDTEIEAKFFPTDKEWARKRLRAIGATLQQPETLMRRVVYGKEQNPQIDGTYVRVRDEGAKIRLSLKVSGTEHGEVTDQKELDLTVEDFEKTRLLLSYFGLRETGYQENFRETWTLNDTEIVIDTWPGLPSYIEIEAPSEAELERAARLMEVNWEERSFVSTGRIYSKVYGLDWAFTQECLRVCTFEDNVFVTMTPVKSPVADTNFPQLLMFLILFGLSLVSPASAQEAPFKIGNITGLTGPSAKWNRYQNMGALMAVEEYRANGIAVDLINEDSKTSTVDAISAFHKLTGRDKVDALLGADFGFVLAPLLPLTAQRKMLFVTLSLPHEHHCEKGAGYFYTVSSQVSRSHAEFDRFFQLHPEIKRIATVTFDDPEWGESYRKVWGEITRARGVTIVDEIKSAEMKPDYRSLLPRILQKKPDAIFLAQEPETFLKMLKQFRYEGKLVTANNLLELLVPPVNPELDLTGVLMVDLETSTEFQNAFQKRFGENPILEAYAGYEGIRTIVQALQKDRTNPADGIKKVSYEGVAGPIDFTRASCVGNDSGWRLYKFEGRTPIPVSQ